METEKTSHETEESVILAQFTATRPTDPLTVKLQNGSQSPDLPPQPLNGGAGWSHFKSGTGVNQMKRHRENSSSPDSMQGLFDQGPYAMNGEMKHALNETSLVGPHQPKKLRINPDMNGEQEVMSSWDKTEPGAIKGQLDGFPEPVEFECNALQKEPKLDKRNCSYPNGDIFSLSRNKQVPMTNGAMVTPPSVEGPAGDLEKTLSQYYPEHVSIAAQTGSSQADEIDRSFTSNLSDQATQSPSLTSGFPISSQISNSGPQTRASPKGEGSNGYNTPFVVNGYSGSFGAEHQQQQQQPYPLPDLPDLESDSLSQVAQDPQANMSNCSHAQNGTECFPSNPEGPSIFSKPNQEFSQDSYPLPPIEGNATPQTEGAGTFGSFSNSAGPHAQSTQTGQQHLQYGVKQQQQPDGSYSTNSGSLQVSLGSAQHTSPPLTLQQQQSVEQQTSGSRPKTLACPPVQQTQCTELENELSLASQTEGIPQRTDSRSQMGWIDLNSAPPPQPPASQQHMWRSFHPQAQTEQKRPQNGPTHSLCPDPSQSFQSQGYNQSSFSQQDCHAQGNYKQSPIPEQAQPNAAPEWQQTNSNTQSGIHSQLNMQLNNIMPTQANNQFCAPMQQQQLCKDDQDLEQILSPGFMPQKQLYEGQQQSIGALQRQNSQDGQSVKMPLQPQEPSQGPLNRKKVDAYMCSEGPLGSPSYRAPKQPAPPQARSSPSVRANTSFGDPMRPSSQPLPNDMATMFGFSEGDVAGMPDNQKFSKILQMQKQQQQRSYTQSPGAQKQYNQQSLNHRLPNHADFPKPSPAQSQSQLPQGALGQQIYPKTESQESCAQFMRGPLSSPGAQGDFQRHAALRMHLLQRQERQGLPQSISDLRPGMQALKHENGPRFGASAPVPCPQIQQQQDRELTNGMPVVVKQEQQSPASTCEQGQERSILATMEQQLRQYQLSPVFERKSLVIKSPNKVKVEMSGGVTVLSTNADMNGEDMKKPPDLTPTKKEPGLQSFLESPMKLLDTPIKNLLDTPVKTQYDIPPCHCVEQISEKDEGPYYTHLGAAPTVAGIRELMEKRSGLTGSAIRIEKVVYTGKEGKSTQGCPIAKWVIRRASLDEKILVLVRERASHTCEAACIVVVILIWEGIPTSLADRLYVELSDTLTKHGAHTNRRCALNEERTCACQGLDPEACGASFSFGCSWSMYYNGCKFARSKIPRKFKLLGDDPKEEEKLEQSLQSLATLMAPTYKKMAPDAYANQVEHEHRAPDCRLGLKEGRPFSGVTACLDFCAHAHRDLHNMQGGSTVVCTLTREDNREVGKIPEDEQLHVLPLYKASTTDEFGSVEGQLEKTKTGAIQVLSAFRRQVRMLAEPAKSCRQKKLDAKKAAANKALHSETPNSKGDKVLQAKLIKSTYENPGQNASLTGPAPGQGHVGASLQQGQHPPPLAVHHQSQQHHQQQPSTPHSYPGPLHPASYARFPNSPGSFPSTSKPPNMYPQPPTPASPYPSPLHVPTSYMNGSNTPSPYPGSLPPNNLYPGYQCNGGMPIDNYHPYYSSNPKHLDMYRQQRPSLYTEHQYGAHQRYSVNYPSRYGEPTLQVNGYNNCSVRPSIHPMGHYPPYGPNGAPDPQFLEAISRTPSGHPSLDYAAVGKGNQFGGYPGPYLPQNPQMLSQNMDSLHMQNKPELNLHAANGISQVLPPLGSECLNPNQPSGFGLPNGNIQGPMIKQEPGTQTPTLKEPEDVWSDNEHNFLDPEIGGVAVAPSHGSILIECAKRELHATTPLKRPDRNHPTRISLVFYQHKNMNEAKHGLALWEAKMAEKAREKEEDNEKHGADSTPVKGSSKKVKRENPEHSEPSEPPYKRFIQTLMERSLSFTTNTYISTAPYAFTKVTGPYNHFM